MNKRAIRISRKKLVEVYQEGFSSGKSPTGQIEDNPYRGQNGKLRREWNRGWMDGGEIFLTTPTP